MKFKNIFSNKIINNSLLLITGLFIGWLLFYHSDKTSSTDASSVVKKAEIWTCSMHPQIRMDHKGLCPICAMDLILLTQSSSSVDDNAIVMTKEAMMLANVQTIIISNQQLEKELRLYGKIQADERSVQSLPAHVPGRIEKLFLNFTGEKVSKGQLIAKIYSPDLINAQQELIEVVKIKELQPKLYFAAKEKLKQLKLSDKQIEEIEKSLQPKSVFDVFATASGVVISKKVNDGDYVQTGTALYEVADLSNVWALFDAYESDLQWLKIGSPVSYTLLAMPGKKLKGNISFIDPVIDPQTRIARVRVELNNNTGEFKPEMLATGVVKAKLSGSGKSIVIPQSAVLWTGTRSLVYVKIPETVEPTFLMREVTLGNYLQNSYEILDGITEGEEIVTNGTFSVDAAAQLEGKSSMMNVDYNASSETSDSDISKMDENSEPNNSIETTTFKVSGNCSMCKDRIESASKKISGVSKASWNEKTKMLNITFDKDKTNLPDIQKAIAAVGHDNGKQIAPIEVYNNLHECCKYRPE